MFQNSSPETGQVIGDALETLNNLSSNDANNCDPTEIMSSTEGTQAFHAQQHHHQQQQFQQFQQWQLQQYQLQFQQGSSPPFPPQQEPPTGLPEHSSQQESATAMAAITPQPCVSQAMQQSSESTQQHSTKNVSTDEWQFTRKKRKRNIETASDAPPSRSAHAYQGTTGINVFNKFSPLDNLNENEISKDETDVSIPPIFVPNIKNVPKLVEVLKHHVNEKDYTYKMYSDDVKIIPYTIEAYRKLIKALDEKDAEYHTFQPKQNRAFRVVLRYIHPSVNEEEIKEELKSQGHFVRNIHNVRHRVTKKPLSLYFIDLEPRENNKEIYKIDKLLNAIIKFEPPYKKKTPVQCHRCQEYGHTRTYCKATPRCVKCGDEHLTNECTKDKFQPATCALCSRNHPANYKGCQVYQNYINKRNREKKEISPPIKNHQKAPVATEFPPLPSPSPQIIHSLNSKYSSNLKNPTQSQAYSIYRQPPFISSNPSQISSYNLPSNPPQIDLCKVIENSFQKFENILKQQSDQIGTLISLLTTLISKMH